MLLLLTRVPGLLCRDKGSSEPVIPCPTVARGGQSCEIHPSSKAQPRAGCLSWISPAPPFSIHRASAHGIPRPHQALTRASPGNDGEMKELAPRQVPTPEETCSQLLSTARRAGRSCKPAVLCPMAPTAVPPPGRGPAVIPAPGSAPRADGERLCRLRPGLGRGDPAAASAHAEGRVKCDGEALTFC